MAEPAADVVIIGAGVIGLSCAYFLQKQGRSVLLLERGEVGCGASHGNCGMISPSHSAPIAVPGLIPKALRWMWQPDAPLYIKPTLNPRRLAWLWRFARRCNWTDFWSSAERKHALLKRSRELFEQLIVGEKLACEYAPVGHLCVYKDVTSLAKARESLAVMTKLGIEAELWDAATVQAREPALREGMAGALYNAGDGHFRPDRYVAELARVVRERGGVIRTGTEVLGFECGPEGVRAVRTAGAVVPAKVVVLACGAWSPVLGKQLGMKLAIEPVKGYSITMSCPRLMPRTSIVFSERGVAVTPWSSGFRLGSTYEFSGFDLRDNPVRVEALRRAAREYLREPLGEVVEEQWFGFRPMTVDGLPYLQRAPGLGNAFVAAGHGTLGMSMSPATGERIARLVTGNETSSHAN